LARAGLADRLALRPPQRVVILQTAFLGDTVFTSALAGGLRARWPQAELDLCVAPRGRDVAAAIEGVAQVIVFDKRGADSGPRGLWRAARRLAERRHDLAVLAHRSARSGLLARLAAIPERLGFAGTAAGLFCNAVADDEGTTFLDREAALLRAVGARPAPMQLRATAEQRESAAAALERLGIAGESCAVLCPGSEWGTKMWPAASYAELAERLHERGFAPLILGAPREVPLADEIRKLARAPVASAAGNSVGESLGMLAAARLAVGGDSGLVHAARALGVPTVMLFGPTAPEAHSFGPRERALSLQLDCSPCSSHGTRRCPLGHHRCMRELDVARVLEAASALARPGAA
jgi:heptosyltransferase-2